MVGDTAKRTAFGWNTEECGNVLLEIKDFTDARAAYQTNQPTPPQSGRGMVVL
jgi:hypothetical protein